MSRRAAFGAIAALVLASVAAAVMLGLPKRHTQASPLVSRFEVVPPPEVRLSLGGADREISISPDGRHIAYRSGPAGVAALGSQLVVRTLDRVVAQAVPGVTNARQPFFSSDSQWIGFFEGATLKKVSIAGGAAISICETGAQSRGASWGDDDRIVFATTDTANGLFQVPSGGGEPQVLTRPAMGERNHWYPSVLPGGRGVLFTITAPNAAASALVAVLDSRTGRHKVLTRGSQAEYAESGHLLYVASGTLHAVRFDLESLEMRGDPMPLVEGVRTVGGGAAGYAVSRDGTLAYVPAADGMEPVRSVVWVDRSGQETPIPVPPRAYETPRVSPDGARAALTIRDQDTDIYILDLQRQGPLRRLTFDAGIDSSPVWTPDGKRIVFQSGRGGAQNLYSQAADGTGAAERVTTSPFFQVASFITPDGAGVIGYEMSVREGFDILRFSLNGSPAEPVIRTPDIESNPEISPDGRYIAYQSNESGPYEIYVRPYPNVDAGKWQATSGGGTRPAWARNGRELFYLDSANMLAAIPVQTSGSTLILGNPAEVFKTAYAEEEQVSSRSYDVSADGKRFLMLKENAPADRTEMRNGFIVVLHWLDELKARLPGGR